MDQRVASGPILTDAFLDGFDGFDGSEPPKHPESNLVATTSPDGSRWNHGSDLLPQNDSSDHQNRKNDT